MGEVIWEVSVDSSIARAHQHASGAWRPLAFDKSVYARHNVVERCINRLKQWRGLATR